VHKRPIVPTLIHHDENVPVARVGDERAFAPRAEDDDPYDVVVVAGFREEGVKHEWVRTGALRAPLVPVSDIPR
jgi:hypothetical protein